LFIGQYNDQNQFAGPISIPPTNIPAACWIQPFPIPAFGDQLPSITVEYERKVGKRIPGVNLQLRAVGPGTDPTISSFVLWRLTTTHFI